jgi:hypothetical protein
MKTKYELHEGVNGNGNTMWMVVAVDANGNWRHTHYFDNKAEATCWMKYA